MPDAAAEPPGADLFVFEADELEQIVTDEVGGSALFASRFRRECAARALLLPRLNPNRRSPLWQQRQRSAQLLEVAKRHPAFPIILETLREVLQDVYDLPSLLRLTRQIGERRIRLVEITTSQPSPYARDLLFGYVGAFMYEGDSPLAERRAAALSVDPALLSELLGKVEMRELLDPDVIAQFEREAQRLDPDRKARGVEGVADLLRILGPLDASEVAQRLDTEGDALAEAESHLAALVDDRRAIRVTIAASPGSRGSKTPVDCATRSVPPFPSASRTPSSSRSPIRSATWSPASRARTPPSRRMPSRSAWASASRSRDSLCSASNRRDASRAGSSSRLFGGLRGR